MNLAAWKRVPNRRTGGPVPHLLSAILGAAIACLQACGSHPTTADRALFEQTCSQCHSLDIPLRRNRDLGGWRRTVESMRQRGARLTDDEAERIARYLEGIRPRN